jgi:hypothetical protein
MSDYVPINKYDFAMSVAQGAVAGMFYHVLTWYTKKQYPVDNLDPRPEAFCVDTAAFHLFAKLNRYRAANPTEFINALQKTDSLLKLEKELGTWTAKSKDLIRAEFYYKSALKSAKKLCASHVQQLKVQKETNKFSKVGSAELKNVIKNCGFLLEQLEEFLNIHIQNVTELVSLS